MYDQSTSLSPELKKYIYIVTNYSVYRTGKYEYLELRFYLMKYVIKSLRELEIN